MCICLEHVSFEIRFIQGLVRPNFILQKRTSTKFAYMFSKTNMSITIICFCDEKHLPVIACCNECVWNSDDTNTGFSYFELNCLNILLGSGTKILSGHIACTSCYVQKKENYFK